MTANGLNKGDEHLALLFNAAFGDPRCSPRAYNLWRKCVDLDHEIGQAAFACLPALYARLSKQAIEDDFTGRLRGICKQNWTRLRLKQDALSEVCALMNAHAVPAQLDATCTGLADGATARQSWYGDALELVVPAGQSGKALSALKDNGWRVVTPPGALPRTSLWLHGPGRQHLRLRWQVMEGVTSEAADAAIWNRAYESSLGPAKVFLPDAEDALIDLLTRPVREHETEPMRWVCAVEFLRSATDQIDWDRLVLRARELRATRRTLAALRRLDDLVCGLPTGYAIHELERAPASWLERAEERVGRIGDAGQRPPAFARLAAYILGRTRSAGLPVIAGIPYGLAAYVRMRLALLRSGSGNTAPAEQASPPGLGLIHTLSKRGEP
ncbi:MAG TPA: nucleotidyltransferase family protein [Hyphomonas sp.]|nr:nucleotidyltransferase family protein [Hyphomonas sp.]MCC0050264.1 nucleotidyltransferase family protein [Rhodobiaceae bacterium]MCA8903293.1 nucleotidyltransferase family protein [Hyphomonas sp.]MCB9961638.1 nucleotidyltransferase family protein [Hyphomonas sp.]MCB9971195.1 nucleotidyltransferase family protein [Hyphomonas sp.]